MPILLRNAEIFLANLVISNNVLEEHPRGDTFPRFYPSLVRLTTVKRSEGRTWPPWRLFQLSISLRIYPVWAI